MNTWKLFLSFSLLLTLAPTVPCYAETVSGQVYQVDSKDIFVKINASTTVRVPVQGALFRVHGETVPPDRLLFGQHVLVDYTPLHGFQRYYHTSSDLEGSKTVFILSDINPDDLSVVEWDGDLYRPVEP